MDCAGGHFRLSEAISYGVEVVLPRSDEPTDSAASLSAWQ